MVNVPGRDVVWGRIRREHLFLSLILGLALALRLLYLNGGYMHPDEHWDVGIAEGFLAEGMGAVFQSANWQRLAHLPLNGLLISLSFRLFGESPAAARIVPITFALLTVGVAYLIGRFYDGRTGLLSAFLVSISGFHVVYSHIVTAYALMTFVFALVMFLAYQAVVERRKSYFYPIPILLILALYSNLFSLLLTVIVVAYIAFCYFTTRLISTWWAMKKGAVATEGRFIPAGGALRQKLLKPVTLMTTLLCLAMLMLYILLLYKAGSFERQTSDFVSGSGWYVWDFDRGAYHTGHDHFFYLRTLLFSLAPSVSLLGLVGVGYALRKRLEADMLLLVWVFVSILLLSIFKTKMPRYAMFLVLPLLILVARSIGQIFELVRRGAVRWANISVTLILATTLYQPVLFQFISTRTVFGPALWLVDYKMIAELITPHISESELVLADYGAAYRYWTQGGYVKGMVGPYLGAMSKENLLNHHPRLAMVTVWQKGRIGSGGGPVWLSGKYGEGRIELTTVELDRLGSFEYIQPLIDRQGSTRIASLYLDSEHDWLTNRLDGWGYSYDGYDASRNGVQAALERVDRYDTIIVGSGIANPNWDGNRLPDLEKASGWIRRFVSKGGSLIILGVASNEERNQVISWLPLRTMVYSNVVDRDFHYARIWYAGELVDLSANGFFYAYDDNYHPVASTEDFAILSTDYVLVHTLRSFGRPTVWIYRRK
ncbi:MAG: glycosyltransferase family 39 protein [Anaerolineae bacterium]